MDESEVSGTGLDPKAVEHALRALGRLPPRLRMSTSDLKLVISPREAGLQEKEVPVAQLAQKTVAMRNKLRVLEQRLNASSLSDDEKIEMQAEITRLYDAFASFMAFFSDDALPQASEAGGDA